MATQRDQVWDYLKEHGSLTQWEALIELGVMRLASRISELHQTASAEGYVINSHKIPVTNRKGEIAYIARYSISKVGRMGLAA